MPVTNRGDRRGSEVVQLYVGDVDATVERPGKELKAFAKIELAAGETTSVSLDLDDRSFAYWDAAGHGWRVEPGEFELSIGSSSRDIRRRVQVTI
jgi:beta-glucosidase